MKVLSLRLIMENNFIQWIVCSCISPMTTNIVLTIINCLRLVAVTLIFDGTPQIIVRRWQITVRRWPNDNSSAADNAIFKNGAKSSSNVASAVWHVAPFCWNQMLLISSSSTHSFWTKICSTCPDNDCHWLLGHFRRKIAQLSLWSKICTKQWLVLGASGFQNMSVEFLCPKCYNFACLHTRQDQNELHLANRHLL